MIKMITPFIWVYMIMFNIFFFWFWYEWCQTHSILSNLFVGPFTSMFKAILFPFFI